MGPGEQALLLNSVEASSSTSRSGSSSLPSSGSDSASLHTARDSFDSYRSAHEVQTTYPEELYSLLYRLVLSMNFKVWPKPIRLFEFADLSLCPPFIRRRTQDMLTAQWIHKLPLLQSSSPAALAVRVIAQGIDDLGDLQGDKLTVVDFGSGSGGPMPYIEKAINMKRAQEGRMPVPFLVSDLHPHLDAWMDLKEIGGTFDYFPEPLDATNPPNTLRSINSPTHDPNEYYKSDTRIFRTYCLAFHHFDDTLARKVLLSSLDSSDAFAIIELQDRRIASVILMFLDYFLMFATSLLWFWHDWLRLLFTFVPPWPLPFIMAFDGFVSSLRTREYEEVMALLDQALRATGEIFTLERYSDGRWCLIRQNEVGVRWVFSRVRERHTWPLGYMICVVGRKEGVAGTTED